MDMIKRSKGFVQIIIPIILALAFIAGIGYYAYRNGQLRSTSPQKQVEISPSSTADSSANWKTYTNKNFSFSVKYNPAFNPDEIAGSVQQLVLISFGTMKNGGFDIEISTGDSIDYYKNQIIDHITQKIDKEEKISVDGVPATRLTYKQVIVIDEFDVSRVIVNRNNRDYIITAVASDIDQILSTFKFLENNESIIKPTGAQSPAAGVCASVRSETLVTVTKEIDYVFSPRCSKVLPNQKLKIVNKSDQIVKVDIGKYKIDIEPGKSYEFPETLGSFLGSGVHSIGGAEIWMQ